MKENYKQYVVSILLVPTSILLVSYCIALTTIQVPLFSMFLPLIYMILIHYLYKLLNKGFTEKDIFFLILLYIIIAIIFIVFSGIIADEYHILQYASKQDGNTTKLVDAIYWANSTFTTLGYGDILPTNTQGKIFSISLSMLGTIHMVTFMSLLLIKFSKSNNVKS